MGTATIAREKLAGAPAPVVHVIGQSSRDGITRYLVRTAWTSRTYEVSSRGLQVLRSLDLNVLEATARHAA